MTDPIESGHSTKSGGIPGCGPEFGFPVLESDGILVSELDGTYWWAKTDLYY